MFRQKLVRFTVCEPLAAWRALVGWVLLACLGGCALPGSRHEVVSGPLGDCARLYVQVDRLIHAGGSADAEAARVAGFPYLRVNRALQSLRPQSVADDTFEAWARRLLALDVEARRIELANLQGVNAPHESQLAACGERLLTADMANIDSRTKLASAATVADDYRATKRILGAYPLTAIGFKSGVKRLHAELLQDFQSPLSSLPVHGSLQRFAPNATQSLSRDAVADLLAKTSANALAIPEPNAHARDLLFATYAPVFEVDIATDSDRIGRPVWRGDVRAEVDTSQVRVYTKTSLARFNGRTLLQLNYVTWFPSRPRQGTFDLLGGHMDGLIWRVTLRPDGSVLAYDSVHNCGCYHTFVLTEHLREKPQSTFYHEPVFAPQEVSSLAQRPVLRIASRTHFLQHVYFTDDAAVKTTRYNLAAYDELRSLPAGAARRSLFTRDGFVAGTDRSERWLFWPMGIDRPGAMRQFGRHPVAFIGRRHFDDLDLFERLFEPLP